MYLTGSSCSGKTTLGLPMADRVPDLAVHDVDEARAPRGAPAEHWVRRALEYQGLGRDTLVLGQAPLGEILAAPSAPLLDGIAMCLVDVGDEVRRVRLAQRQPGTWDAAAVDAFLRWAAWHRGHARDPRHRPEVLTGSGRQGPGWQRWTHWRTGDPRWAVRILDTTDQPEERSLGQVAAWIARQRDLRRGGSLPLGPGWHEPSGAQRGADRLRAGGTAPPTDY